MDSTCFCVWIYGIKVMLIKMGGVFNSLSPKGDTENYTDMWW